MAISQTKRFTVLHRDNFTCNYCGRAAPETILEIDHIVPKATGGTDDIDNLLTACRDCNNGKSDTLLDTATSLSSTHDAYLWRKAIYAARLAERAGADPNDARRLINQLDADLTALAKTARKARKNIA